LILTTSQIAEIFGVLPRTVTLYGERGCPKKGKNAWDIKEVVQWWAENIYAPEDNEESDIYVAKLEYWRAKARVEQVKATKLEESVIPIDDVLAAWAWRVSEMSGMLAALGLRLAPMLEGLDEIGIREKLNEELWKVRDNFARKGRFMGD